MTKTEQPDPIVLFRSWLEEAERSEPEDPSATALATADTAGAVALSFPLFVIASFIGRGARFFLVAGIIAWGGERMERALRSHVETAGWLALIVLVGAYLFLRK